MPFSVTKRGCFSNRPYGSNGLQALLECVEIATVCLKGWQSDTTVFYSSLRRCQRYQNNCFY